MRTGQPRLRPTRRGLRTQRPRTIALAALLAAVLPFAGGCPGGGGSGEERLRSGDLSLLEIGTLSLDLGEKAEERGALDEAQPHYARAVWALETLETLTGEHIPLLDDARESLRRVRESRDAARDLRHLE
jgi:hypothetical protein